MPKRKVKMLWVPNNWIEWLEKYYEENREMLEELGIYDVNELVWRLAALGKLELAELIRTLLERHKKPLRHERSE